VKKLLTAPVRRKTSIEHRQKTVDVLSVDRKIFVVLITVTGAIDFSSSFDTCNGLWEWGGLDTLHAKNGNITELFLVQTCVLWATIIRKQKML
jgi:hypothetical protein